MKTSGCPAPAPTNAPASLASPAKWRWLTWASFSAWKSRAWRRNNADWYRLLELCGITDTLIGDNDGVYHPALFNDRLLLGLKGTMSEAELHIIRARLDGGIRNKAARGELRRGLPVGFIWGEQDGEVLFHPDEAVTGAIRTVFERFAEFGSARRVWLWFRSEGLSFPLQTTPAGLPGPIRWVAPTYTALHHILTNPVYAGAYTYGKTKYERYVDEHGAVRETDAASAHGAVGRSHSGPSSRFHRLGDLPSQSGAARFQHAAASHTSREAR